MIEVQQDVGQATYWTRHAGQRAQQRGVRKATVGLILSAGDRSRKVGKHHRAIWLSRKGRERLQRKGYAVAEVERASGVRVIVNTLDDLVVTVVHAGTRRLKYV